jgi:Ca2+-binding EF-hand superfamily protein
LRFRSNYDEQLQFIKMFAFNLFDMNCDGFICENDVMALLNSVRNSDILQYIYKDLILLMKLLFVK